MNKTAGYGRLHDDVTVRTDKADGHATQQSEMATRDLVIASHPTEPDLYIHSIRQLVPHPPTLVGTYSS